MRNDVLISLSVLLGLFFTFVLRMPLLDIITGLIVSIFIIKTSIGIFIDSTTELLDGVKDTEIYSRIFEAVNKVEGAKHPHRVRSSLLGGLYVVSLDIEADGNITLIEAHHIAEMVEESIKKSIDNIYDVMVHVEPIGIVHAPEPFGVSLEDTSSQNFHQS
jgi:cation diffusion facilitator family transporter